MLTLLSSPPSWDRSWFEHVNRFARATPWLHASGAAVATYAVVLVAALLLGAALAARRHGSVRHVTAALWAPLGVLLAVGLNQPVVNAVSRPRPFAALPRVLVLVARSSDPSLPSDHATMAGAAAAGLCLVSWRWGVAGWVTALVLCAARVYVGVHYPGDVLAGLALGAAVTLLAGCLARPVLAHTVRWLVTTPVGRLLVWPSGPAPAGATSPERAASRTPAARGR